jgi:antitoxin HicB
LVPELPGCITYGNNRKHALKMAKEAIELYLESVQADAEENKRIKKTKSRINS